MDFNTDLAAQEEYDAWSACWSGSAFDVECRTCDVTDRDSQDNLQAKGWTLTGRGEFCPSH